MQGYSARMVHPEGPHGFPKNPLEDRDQSRDPRSVFTLAENEDQAIEILLKDNPGFKVFEIKVF